MKAKISFTYFALQIISIIGFLGLTSIIVIYEEYLILIVLLSITALNLFLFRDKNKIYSIEIINDQLVINKSKKSETHFNLNEIKRIEYGTSSKRFGAMNDRGSESFRVVFKNGIGVSIEQIKYSNYYDIKNLIYSYYYHRKSPTISR